MRGFRHISRMRARTKRAPVISNGKRGTAVWYLPEFACAPLDPVDPELRQRLALDSPHELKQTFVDGDIDIVEGDILVVGNAEYPIRSCAEWLWRGRVYRHLVVEELK